MPERTTNTSTMKPLLILTILDSMSVILTGPVRGDSDKGIKLIFTISTFVQATLSFRGTVTLTYEHSMSSMADLFDSRSRFSCKSFDSFNARFT